MFCGPITGSWMFWIVNDATGMVEVEVLNILKCLEPTHLLRSFEDKCSCGCKGAWAGYWTAKWQKLQKVEFQSVSTDSHKLPTMQGKNDCGHRTIKRCLPTSKSVILR